MNPKPPMLSEDHPFHNWSLDELIVINNSIAWCLEFLDAPDEFETKIGSRAAAEKCLAAIGAEVDRRSKHQNDK